MQSKTDIESIKELRQENYLKILLRPSLSLRSEYEHKKDLNNLYRESLDSTYSFFLIG